MFKRASSFACNALNPIRDAIARIPATLHNVAASSVFVRAPINESELVSGCAAERRGGRGSDGRRVTSNILTFPSQKFASSFFFFSSTFEEYSRDDENFIQSNGTLCATSSFDPREREKLGKCRVTMYPVADSISAANCKEVDDDNEEEAKNVRGRRIEVQFADVTSFCCALRQDILV